MQRNRHFNVEGIKVTVAKKKKKKRQDPEKKVKREKAPYNSG